MLTAARVVAAICLGVLGFLASERIKVIFPYDMNFGYFSVVNLVVGLICGWMFLGPRAGRGWTPAINNGLTGVLALVFWGLFVQGAYQMWVDAHKRLFDGMVEAVVSIFERMIEYGAIMIDKELITTLVAGAVISGLLTELAKRAWR